MGIFRRLAALGALALALAITGCATVPMGDVQQDAALKSFPPPAPGKAGLYIYRNETFGAAVTQVVDLDGFSIGQSAAKTYFYAEVAPGRHTVASRAENTDTLEFTAVVGKLYFVWQEIRMGLIQARTKLTLVSDAEGKKGVQESKLAASNVTPPRSAQAAAPSAASTQPQAARPPAAPAAAVMQGRYAGPWSGTYRCGPFLGTAQVQIPGPIALQVRMNVHRNHATLNRGDASYNESLEGDVAPDGSITLWGKGALAQSTNLPWTTQFQGRFTESPERFEASGNQTGMNGVVSRNCTLELVRGAGGR